MSKHRVVVEADLLGKSQREVARLYGLSQPRVVQLLAAMAGRRVGARGSRPNRTKVYSVRLSDQEEDQIQKLAESKHFHLRRLSAHGSSNASTVSNLHSELGRRINKSERDTSR
jgi:transposase